MIESTLMFLLIVASLGVGGVLGLLSMVVMAIEIATRGLLTKRAWKGAYPTRPMSPPPKPPGRGYRPIASYHESRARAHWCAWSGGLIYLVLGAFFALLTARVLLWEVHSVSDLTADHLLTIGAIVGAIAAGHFLRVRPEVVAPGGGAGTRHRLHWCHHLLPNR